ncbi:HET-domain-containing protein [Aaosphaeria arxii CBS 175.79]|uniref:HET-domain-containing protein n=1 Tax=Aaosphaeria arxii CBS 175.79 TaxID=1450172 RepID=A0A6A5XL66_9PLEO|nr:HET-domain-containing protein [Aaosphaeria arxii CBS 175.79]KAF2013547.1 HET-domain-containing protein [Aaosphaeria arxii CBS 175.79]
MHGKHCNHRELPLRNSTPIDVILVDVFDECITQTSTSSQYFALSYVWGNAITTTTTSKNLSQLQQPGSLKQDMVLPQTVSDAIVLTRKMGVRYLWVDCLSIIQDSAKKHQHLADMDIIFSQAELTIVAISGKDANAPLSGVRPGTRKPRVTSIVQGRYLMSLKLPVTKDDILFGTVYDSRGWAFQELIVSKRTLFVTEHQLVFHCGVSRRSESHPKETIHDHREFSWGLIDLRPQWFLPHCEHVVLDSYVSMVQQYCSKRLSFQSDIENAFAGLASILEQWCNGQPVVHGLLSSFFGYSMLWNTNVDQGHLAAANATLLPLLEKRREGFPSWSWVGWMMNTSNVGKNSAVKLPLHSLIRNVEITSTTAGKKSLSTTVLDKSAREGLFNKSGQQIRINIKPVTAAAAAAESDQDVSPQPVNTLDFEAERADWDKFVVSTSTSHRLATTTTPEILFRPRGSNSIAGYLSLAPDDSIIQQATINNASLLPLSKSSTFSSMSSFSTTTSISSSSSAGPHQPHALIKMYRIKLKPWNRVRDSLQTILEVFERNGHLTTTASSSPGKTGAEDLRDRLGKEKVLYVLLVRRKGTRWERVGSGMMFERFWPKGRSGERKRDKVMGRGKVRANRKRICIV